MERNRTPMHRYGEADFDEDYLRWGFHDAETQNAEADSVLRIAGGGKPLRILDLGCGTGAHAIRWALQGHTVTGIDLSETFIARARERASLEGASVEFVVSDIREFDGHETYDVVTWIENSFFDDDIANRVCSLLRDGGCFILDVRNPENPKTKFRESNWRTWRDDNGVFHLERHETDECTGVHEDAWITIDPHTNAIHERVNTTEHPMTVEQKADAMSRAGFDRVELRTLEGELFSRGPEPYWLWLVARKHGAATLCSDERRVEKQMIHNGIGPNPLQPTNGRPRVLQRAIVTALSECPHALSIEPFGSVAAGFGDEYSDVDLRVEVDDLAAALNARHALLGVVGPLAVEWIVHSRPDSFCSTVLFAEESCYHKVDLEFWTAEAVARDEAANSTQIACADTALYIPEPDAPGHFLLGQLLGGTRYAKARKRGQSLTCWRFCSAMMDWTCVLLHEQANRWQDSSGKLTTEQFLALDASVDAAMVRRIFSAFELSSGEKMDSAVLQLLDIMAELAFRKGECIGRPIPEAPVSWLLRFLKTELASVGLNE